ncbi:MAG TPA: FAD-binding oxidoreductase [Oceanospirillaceae bacterium]|nr:FAD-binding oxidoreductase [Oceanospirillaceae bacterium]
MSHKVFAPLPANDNGCGWTQALDYRQANVELQGEQIADFVVIGAGYTGLSAARKFAQLNPNAKVVVLEAQQAAEGASARNSGYLVDSTLNDGHMSDTGLQQYRDKYNLNKSGVDCVSQLVDEHQIDCDWQAQGKFHATAVPAHQAKLQRFSQLLAELDLDHRILEGAELKQRLGTRYYTQALWTAGGIMLQPAKLARGYINILPDNVSLFENSPVLTWRKQGSDFLVSTPMGQIKTPKLLMAVNGFFATRDQVCCQRPNYRHCGKNMRQPCCCWRGVVVIVRKTACNRRSFDWPLRNRNRIVRWHGWRPLFATRHCRILASKTDVGGGRRLPHMIAHDGFNCHTKF